MKKERKILLVVIIIILITLIGTNISLILEKNIIVKSDKHIIKEMSESTQVTDLNNQINSLNATHTEYMKYIQTCKTQIASALTNEGVTTSNEATLETMAENISRIFIERTKLDSAVAATADNITKGKKAYVNGQLITGNGTDNNSNYTNGIGEGLKSLYSSTPYTQSKSDVGGGVTATDADHNRHTINGSKSYRFYLTSANGSNALLTSITATVELGTSTAYSEGHASASLSWTITDNNGNSWASGNSAGTIVFDPLNKKVGNIEYLDLNMTYYAMAYTDPGQPNSRGSATAKFSNIKGNYIVI